MTVMKFLQIKLISDHGLNSQTSQNRSENRKHGCDLAEISSS